MGKNTKKDRIEFLSPIDALVETSKQLSVKEEKYHMETEDFYDKYEKGVLDDSIVFIYGSIARGWGGARKRW